MQGHSSSVESLPETFEFDHGSSSNNSGLDQQLYWNNVLNQAETRDIPNYILNPSNANIPYTNIVDQDNPNLSIWNSDGDISNEHSPCQGGHEDNKMEHEWTSLTINPGGGPRIEEERRIGERPCDAASMLSLENVNITLNVNQDDDGQTFAHNSNLNDMPQNPEQILSRGGTSSEISLCPPISGRLKFENCQSSGDSSNGCTNSSGFGFMSEDGDDRPGGSLDGRRIACKRKIIEGFPGQSSASGSTSFFQQNENILLNSVPAIHSATANINLYSSADYISGANSSMEQPNPRLGVTMRGMVSDCYPSPSVAANAESSHRNFRIRINPARQHDTSPYSLYSQGSNIRCSSAWLPSQPSSPFPFNQSPESWPVIGSSSSQIQPPAPFFPRLPRNLLSFPWNGASTSRIVNSSNSSSEERLISARDGTSSRSSLRNNFPDQSAFGAATDIRQLVQDRTNWGSAGSVSMPGNVAPTLRTSTSSGIHSIIGPSWVPYQNPPMQYPQSSSDVVHRSLFQSSAVDSGGQNSGGQSSHFPLQHSSHSSTSPEVSHQSFRGHRQPNMRSAFLMERQSDGVLGVPSTMRGLATAREGRSRMISEIRNALDLMRRGENLRFEDLLILDQSAVFYGGADLHDRHRDLRLDVDNMSYEELLALEERIGNVSTGLNEETVMKCLKQRKHLLMRAESSVEEQCCICREEYTEGEDLGTLECGHDFHTACIKQWLTNKNLCPICKTNGLVT